MDVKGGIVKKAMTFGEIETLLKLTRRTLHRYRDTGHFKTFVRNQSTMAMVTEIGKLIRMITNKDDGRCTMEETGAQLLEQLVNGQERLLRVSEVGRLLRVSKSTVYSWINEGKIEAVKVGAGKRRGTILVLANSVAGIIQNDF